MTVGAWMGKCVKVKFSPWQRPLKERKYEERGIERINGFSDAVFALSLGLAYVSASNSQYVYFLLIPNGVVLEHMHRRDKSEEP
jgi:hypothetical protein